MCCTKPVDKTIQLSAIAASLDEIKKGIDAMER
jgi:hypothetical protein